MHPSDFDAERFELGSPLWRAELADASSTHELGSALGSALIAGDYLGLVGELGAGKTTLVQGLVEALDESASISAHSPTYTLINLYATRPPVAHMDLYRLEHFEDLEGIGYFETIERGDVIACVEWFSAVEGAWPERGAVLQLEHHGSSRRATLWCAQDDEALRARLLQSTSISCFLSNL